VLELKIEVIQGDIIKAGTTAIVNAANNHLWMGAGVAEAIKKAGGDIIEKEAIAKGPIMPGEAVFTTAGLLPFKCIIHGAVMGQALTTNATLIRQTTIACLNLADQLKIDSLAFPAFGTGVGQFPMTACANLMVRAVIQWGDLAKYIKHVKLCILDELDFGLFNNALSKEQKKRQ